MQIAERLSERALGLDVRTTHLHPCPKFLDKRCAVALSSREALLDTLAAAFGLRIDVEDRGVDLHALDGASVSATQRFDELAPRVGIAATAPAPSALDTIVGCRAVAHHAAEGASRQQLFEMIVVAAGRI